ncbi:RecQ family ATP-dependent DNA helicase, partial [Gottfriedia acidiceleris]|uniref:RecQ family ATP-dependent DNA helicase n=1 Tax=Gottfriedia acidiceleris TaxID=371036 RepID=UPI00300095D0
MIFYSANYVKGSSNFVIQNTDCNNSSSEYLPYLKILKNLLQRGNPTNFSTFLASYFPNVGISNELVFIDRSTPKWSTTIKGDNENNYFPAKEFFYEVIPKYLSNYSYIQQLILPEAHITDIIETDIQFLNSQVDFYLPIAKLVIEIDGEQHKEAAHIISDNQRDELFNNFGIEVIRISTKDIKYKNNYFLDKIKRIENRLELYKDELRKYEIAYHSNEISIEMNATAVMRWQILLLTLLENGKLSLADKEWSFEVIDLENSQQLELSINDLFLWLRNLCALGKIPFQQPKITVNYVTEFSIEDNLKLNFSLRKRWTDEYLLEKEVIFVRSDYFTEKDYFKMSITDPITYKIFQEGEANDVPVLKFFLKNIFGFDDFSDGQLPIIINVLEGKNTVGLLPTGGGKSLCYQLTAMLQPCISFVVAPIKSLMYDQVDNLYRRNFIRTNLICGDQNGEEKERIQKDFARGKYWFILISPERFQIREFRQYLQMVNEDLSIALAVIDEVHCLSEWGHDFRTSYLHLSKTIRKYCPSARFLGLTATASKFVLNDIMKELEVSKDNVKTLLKYTRPELRFNVLKINDEDGYQKRSALFQLLNSFKEKRNIFDLKGDKTSSGLIFTTNVNGKKGCFELSQELTSRYKVPVKYYSGEKPKKSIIPEEEFQQYKVDVQNEFKENEIPLLVATKAFGMGIDKSNIRYTIHYGIPGSLESLYQEAGRAGRDKQQATCYILFSKERFTKDVEDKLFALDTKIEEIKEIVDSYGFDGRDLLSNFFLWQSSLKGVDQEVELAYLIFKRYATPGSIKMIECKKINNSSFQEIQKAIYRLSLLGIVDDWIITGWENRGSFEVTFSIYDEKTIMNSLLKYIVKYD